MDGNISSGRAPWGLMVILVLLVIGSVQTNAEDVCRTGCKESGSSTFKYAVGTTYKYNYDGKIEIALSSAEGQTTSTEVKATVLLTQLNDCNQLLRLQNVQVLGANGKKIGANIPDIEKPIRINVNDGVLDDSICVVDGDNQNSVNIKRAIASIFQASLKNEYETDVFGRCPTDTSSHKEGNVLVIQKARNLNKCAFREHLQRDFLPTAFNLDSEIKSSPILNGDYSAVLRVKSGILEQATVTEDYLYVPFSVGKNGAKAQIVSKLQQAGTSKDSPKAPVTKPRSIIFENPHPVVAPSSNAPALFNAVKEAANTIDVVVSESTAKEFINLLKVIRVSKKSDLLAVYSQVRSGAGVGDKEAAKKLYLDALLRSGNGDSIEAVLDLLKQNELDDHETKMALIGLNFARHTTEGALTAALHLLDTPKLPREAYLGVGNLVGRYCRQHSCENVAAVKELTNKLLSKVANKANNREQENDIIFVLKGIANFQYLPDNAIQKLTNVAQTKNLPNRIRVAALETYLADPCKDKLRHSALQILQDVQQDSEIRIKAYLVVAQCPNAKAGNAIKGMIEKEPSVQVGGFISSHLRSIRASVNPDKALAKQFLGFSVKKHFPIDPRKYSFNGEFSYSVNSLGVASSAEANVIYSQNSWLPRSSSVNLTAEVFGHNFNFLEIETRQENLDRLIEHYFGPKGALNTGSIKEFVAQGRKSYQDIARHLDQKLRSALQRNKRDVTKAEIDYISKQVQIKTNELNRDLDLDLKVKAFGSEMLFLNVNQEAEKLTPDAIIDKLITQLSQGLDKLNSFQETLRQNLIFLDAEIDYPTSLGFPLRLAVEGSASVQLKAEGAVDVRKLINNPENGEMKLKLIPSANVEVAARFTLDALVIENGLKVVSNLYTSSGGDLSLSWNKASGFDLKYSLPVQEQKLVSINHEIVFHSREQAGKELNLPLKFTQVKDFSICLDQLSPFIGLTFCAEVNGPNLGGQQIPVLPFPLSGDAKLAVTIENDDVAEYRIRQSSKGEPPSHLALVLETISKSNQQRKVALELQAEYSPEQYIRALFTSPIKSASAEAKIITTRVEKSLSLKLTNDKDEFVAKIGVAISGSPQRTVYKPILQLKTPAGEQPMPLEVEGQIVVDTDGTNAKYTFQNVRVKQQNKAYSINGDLGREAGVFFSNLKVSDGAQSVALEGRVQLSAELIKFNVKVQNTINPNVNFNLKGEFKRQAFQNDVAVQLIHGQDLNSKTSILTFTTKVLNKFKTSQDFRFEIKSTFSYPLLGFSSKLEFEHTPKSLDYQVSAEYGDLKLGSELELKISEKNVGDYEVEWDLWGLDNKLEIKSRRQVLPNSESKIANTLEINGKKLEVEGVVTHRVNPNDFNVGTDLTVNVPGHAAPLKLKSGLKVSPDDLDAHVSLHSGSDGLIDAFLKANKNGNANGSIKVNVKNLLNINGQIHSNNGAGSGAIQIDLQNGRRQVKGDTSFKIVPGQAYDISANVYPAFNKDQKLKLTFSTQNKVSPTSLDTRNRVDILGNPLEVNAKMSKTGDDKTGKYDGEVEVTLPGDQYIQLRGNCDHKENNQLLNGQAEGSIEWRKNKNAPGRKLGYKSTWRNTNVKEGAIDVDFQMSGDDSNGHNVNVDLGVKTSRQSDAHHLSLNNKVSGSLLKNPLEVSIVSDCNQGIVLQVDSKASYGPANVVVIKGGYNLSGEPKKSGNLVVQMTSESKALKTVNVELQGFVVKPKDESQSIQIEGSAKVFADDDGTNPDPIVDVQIQESATLGPNLGQVQGKLVMSKVDPITVTASYDVKQQEGGSGSVAVEYGNGKTVKLDGSLKKSADHQYQLGANLQTPVEGYKNAHLKVNTKRAKDSRHVNSAVEISVEDKTWKLLTDLNLVESAPSVDIKYTNADGKLSEVYAKGNKVSDKQFSGELKLLNEEREFTLDGSVSVNVENLESLSVKGQVNSPRLNLNKVTFEAHNKGTAQDHKLQVVVKTAGKNYLSGTATYAAKEENGKFIVEGSGNFKVKDESKSGNFKYIQQKLESDKGEEQGVEVTFDATLGERAFDAEFKATNKHFRFQNSYCEQKKECAHIEIDNKVNSNDLKNYNQVLEINTDLRKLGLSHEFGLKAVTDRKEWVIDHTVDVHFQNQENSKYQYSFFLHPREAGLSLTTPKRVIALEAKVTAPQNIRQGGKTNGEIAFYIDKKNHANKKTTLTWSIEANPKGNVHGEAKFNHPGLRKPLSASFKAERTGTILDGMVKVVSELDVFAQPDQKIVSTYHFKANGDKGVGEEQLAIQSKGLGIDILASEAVLLDKTNMAASYEAKLNYQAGKSKYENLLSYKLSRSELNGIVKVLNKVLLKHVTKYHFSEQEQVIESEVSSIDNNGLVSRLEIKNFNTLAYSVGHKNTPNNKLLFNAGLIPGQIADIRSDLVKGGSKTNLFYATVKLDDANFLKSDYNVDSKAIQQVLDKTKAQSDSYFKGLEGLMKEWAEDGKSEVKNLNELAKKSTPNLQPLKQYYAKEFEEIKTEIINDKSVKELGEAARRVLGSVIAAVSELLDRVSQVTEETAVILQKTFESVLVTLERDIIPQLKVIASRLLQVAKDSIGSALDIVFGVLAKASQIVEQYQPELKEIAAAFGDLTQDFGKVLQASWENTRENIRNVIKRVSEELKASAFVEELKAQYEQFLKEGLPSAEVIINTIRELLSTIKDVIPPGFVVRDDINKALDEITDYIEKKLKNQPVNDMAALEQIGQSILNIARKLLSIISAEGYELPGSTKIDSSSFLPLNFVKNIPKLVAVKFSPIAYLLDESLASDITKFLISLVDSPRRSVPPFPLFGIVIQGGHIFTFDGRRITFSASCNYLLARDAVNGNFSLAGSYKDGVLTAITLADKSDSVTLLKTGQAKLNNANTELPARKPEIGIYREYEVVTLVSSAGVEVVCTPDLLGCVVSVSGFYHGQLKGLLGNGNNEEYDDLTLPNGKIVTADQDFVNAYKMSAQCADVAVAKSDAIPDNAVCNKLFNWESSLRYCYPFVPVENFKAACALGLSANVKETEEAVAKAYVAACNERNIPIKTPAHLVKCTNGDKTYDVGDTFSVKLPSKSADIVLIVDTEKKNENLYKQLVQPLVQEISKELHSKGVNDIEFHLLAYGGQNQWPSHVTVNGKMAFKGKAPNIKFTEAPSHEEIDLKEINNPEVQKLAQALKVFLHDLGLATGQNLRSRTFDQAHRYPFRANALKSIIVANSNPCEIGSLYPFQKLFALLYKTPLISLNLFTPLSSLSVKDSKNMKDVVGFDNQHVFTLSQGKKNPKGSEELYKDLNYDDYCVDFTIHNRGNAFVNENFVNNKADQKQFVHIAAVNIVEKLMNIEQGLDCECKLVNPWKALNVCKQAYIKDRLSKKV